MRFLSIFRGIFVQSNRGLRVPEKSLPSIKIGLTPNSFEILIDELRLSEGGVE